MTVPWLARRAALLALAVACGAAHAQVISRVDRGSGVTFISLGGAARPGVAAAVPAVTGTAPARAYIGRPMLAEAAAVASARLPRQPPAGLLALVKDAARGASVDPFLLMALVDVESGWNARARSARGAMGLTQLMPATARSLGVADAYDPAQNVRAGAAHLGGLLSRFEGDAALALAAYNAGEGAVIRHGLRVPPFAETRAYVPLVLQRRQRYRDGLVVTGAVDDGPAQRAPGRQRAVIESYR